MSAVKKQQHYSSMKKKQRQKRQQQQQGLYVFPITPVSASRPPCFLTMLIFMAATTCCIPHNVSCFTTTPTFSSKSSWRKTSILQRNSAPLPSRSLARVTQSTTNVHMKPPTDFVGGGGGELTTSAATASTSTLLSFLDKASQSELTLFALKTLISWALPAVVVVFAIAFMKKSLSDGNDGRRGRGVGGGMFDDGVYGGKTAAEELYDDLYGDSSSSPSNPLKNLLAGGNKNNRGKDRNLLSAPQNVGIPNQQYIKIEKINDVLDSYQYSIDSATKSKAYAAAKLRSNNFDKAMGRAFLSKVTDERSSDDFAASITSTTTLTLNEKMALVRVEEEFVRNGIPLQQDLMDVKAQLTSTALDRAMEDMGVEVGELDPIPSSSSLTDGEEEDEKQITAVEDRAGEGGASPFFAKDAEIVSKNISTTITDSSRSAVATKKDEVSKTKKKKKTKTTKKKAKNISTLYKELATLNSELTKLEIKFMENTITILGPERANAIRAAILGNVNSPDGASVGFLLDKIQERPLSQVLSQFSGSRSTSGEDSSDKETGKKNLFIADFPGDVQASQVNTLREEVTAIIRAAKKGDHALVVLQSGGGTVTGYGLAAAQLQRFKNAGLNLTICVEQVAASGGYMMCCVADKIVASPFAVLGSIGVLSEIPNVYERLKKEGVEFQTVTAGKYKRTITPTKRITQEDVAKAKSDIEDVLTLFKDFVKTNRPTLDIENVATGETWFGEDALKKNLCDEIKTKDEVILEYVDEGWDVYNVKYEPPKSKSPLATLTGGSTILGTGNNNYESVPGNVIRSGIRWLVRIVASEVQNELSSVGGVGTKKIEEQYMAMDISETSQRVKASASTSPSSSINEDSHDNSDDVTMKFF